MGHVLIRNVDDEVIARRWQSLEQALRQTRSDAAKRLTRGERVAIADRIREMTPRRIRGSSPRK